MIRTMLTVCIAGCCLLTVMAARQESTSARPRASGGIGFEPLTASALCLAGGTGIFPNEQPFVLPAGYVQRVLGVGGAYEVDPWTGDSVARPALGAKAQEGIRIDPQGNVYGISETAPNTMVTPPPVPGGPPPVPRAAPGGYIFKFVPDRRADLSSGQLYALKIVLATGDRTGAAIWVPLDRSAVQVDADAEATRAGATGYARPEDVEMATSTGGGPGGSNILYVAVTDEHRVLRIDLRQPAGGSQHETALVSDYVVRGVNAPMDFANPDNLALDKHGNLYITEDTRTPPGMDIWVAIRRHGAFDAAQETVRFASLTDCDAEPSGIYFDKSGRVLFVNVLHRGLPDPRDLGLMITRAGGHD